MLVTPGSGRVTSVCGCAEFGGNWLFRVLGRSTVGDGYVELEKCVSVGHL
jgi:hypothetical protein